MFIKYNYTYIYKVSPKNALLKQQATASFLLGHPVYRSIKIVTGKRVQFEQC